LRLAQAVAGIDDQYGSRTLRDMEFRLRNDQAALDAAHVDIEPRNAVRGDAVEVGVHQRVGQDRGVGRGHAGGRGDLRGQRLHCGGKIARSIGHHRQSFAAGH